MIHLNFMDNMCWAGEQCCCVWCSGGLFNQGRPVHWWYLNTLLTALWNERRKHYSDGEIKSLLQHGHFKCIQYLNVHLCQQKPGKGAQAVPVTAAKTP